MGYADADPYFRILGRTQNRRKKLDSQIFQSELCSPAARPVFRYPEQNQHSDFPVAATTNFPVMLSHSQEGHTCRATSSSLLSNSFSRIFHLHFFLVFLSLKGRSKNKLLVWSVATLGPQTSRPCLFCEARHLDPKRGPPKALDFMRGARCSAAHSAPLRGTERIWPGGSLFEIISSRAG